MEEVHSDICTVGYWYILQQLSFLGKTQYIFYACTYDM